jgi:hypothetical protein
MNSATCRLAPWLIAACGEFKSWRDKFGNTPRKADFAWTVLARMLSFAKDRGIIAVNPCERGGRLDAHYLGRDIQLAEAAVLKLEARTKL